MEELETGDLLLFSTDKWYSKIIEKGIHCKFSHVGIVLKNPTFLNENLNGYYLLESGRENFDDVIDHMIHFGVEIVPLQNVLDEYKQNNEGNIYYRKLKVDRNEQFYLNFKLAYDNVKNKPYNKNIFDWLEVLFGYKLFDKKITNRFWCSALVSYIYVNLNILSKEIDWSLITPKYFSDEKIDFINNCNLGEIKILL
jgi:hypothetical protein